tara:strand:- start:23 stop:433 length:411 start_codon:yes stop_codon:yes gene_type:complete
VNIIETDFWCLMLPPEWSAEEEKGSVLITDQDGIGELAITTLVREPDGAPETSLLDIAQSESPEVSSWAAATFGDFLGVTGEFTEEGAVLQEWYLSHGVALLYCTYACDVEDAGMDMPAVEEILGTLVPGDALLVD